jgi:hypothetical protein
VKLNKYELLSSCAFKCNVRHYSKGTGVGGYCDHELGDQVGRCRLTVSNPELKAHLVSAKFDEPLSSVAFKCILRHYNQVSGHAILRADGVYAEGAVSGARHCGGVTAHVAHMRQAGPRTSA